MIGIRLGDNLPQRYQLGPTYKIVLRLPGYKIPSLFQKVVFSQFCSTHNASHQRQSARVAGTLSDCMRLYGCSCRIFIC